MQVKIRLQRFGTKKRPFYRIVAASEANKRDGQFLEIVGLYHPLSPADKQIRLDKEKITAWLNKGALPTSTVEGILRRDGEWKVFFDAKAARIKKKNDKRKAVREKKAKATA